MEFNRTQVPASSRSSAAAQPAMKTGSNLVKVTPPVMNFVGKPGTALLLFHLPCGVMASLTYRRSSADD